MPALLHAVQTEFTTDFAIVTAAQEGVEPAVEVSFAGSGPGFVRMEAGSKNSHVSIRAERWDQRPPLVDGWEDVDDLPFEQDPSAGALMLNGFDPGTVGLDLGGFGGGRVRVSARGRHRYSYGSDVDTDGLPPEEWLLQLYPLDGPVDPMVGGPRRIAGAGGLARRGRTRWQEAVRALDTSGWSSVLTGSPGFSILRQALWSTSAPVTRLELAMRMARGLPPWTMGGPDAESMAIPPRPSFGAGDGEEDALAGLSGRPRVSTIGEAIDAVLSIGLLLIEQRGGEALLIPNPAPQPTWERGALSGPALVVARSRALEDDHGRIADTIGFAVRWCGEEGLTATPRAMALRWCTTVDDVVGGLRLLGGSGRVTSDRDLGFDTELDADEPLTLRRGEAHDPAFLLVLP